MQQLLSNNSIHRLHFVYAKENRMFTAKSINKYFSKLLPRLAKRYGTQETYSASQIRATVFQCDFKTKYLPLGYVLALNNEDLEAVFAKEYPEYTVAQYKQEILDILTSRKVKKIDSKLLS